MTSLKPISLTESSPARQPWLELLILAGVALVPLSAKWVIAGIYVTTTRIFFLLVLCLWAAAVFRYRRWTELKPAPGLRWLEWSMPAFLLACGVSGLVAVDKMLWGKEMIKIGQLLAIYLFVRSVAFQTLRQRTYLAMLVLVAALTGAVGIAQYFSGPAWAADPRFTIVLGRVRSQLTFGDPNNFAAYLAGAVPLALAAAEYSKRRWLWLAGAGLVTGCLICTYSRSGWIAASVGTAVVLLLRRRRILAPTAILLAIVVAEVMAFSYDTKKCGFVAGLAHKTTSMVDNSPIIFRRTDTLRVDLVRLGVAMFQSHPVLGVGLGNSGQVMPQYFEQVKVSNMFVHDYARAGREMTVCSTPLQLLAELGVLSASMLAVAAGLAITFFRAYRGSSEDERSQVAGLIGACIAVLTASLMGWLFTRGAAETFFLLLGLVSAQVFRHQAFDRGTSKP